MTFTAELQHRGDHAVRFYADDHELVASATDYLATGLRHGEALIVVATRAHMDAFVHSLAEAGLDLDAAREVGRLTLLDADELLAGLQVGGRPARDRFDETLGELVRGMVALGTGVRVYGEMVALLWEDDRVDEAVELEALWNDLAARFPFSLLCAYGCAGDPDPAELARICGQHDIVVGDAPRGMDGVAVQIAIRTFEGTAPDAGIARRFTVDTLAASGLGDIADDAAVVVTELAANAVAHARTCFTVTLSRRKDRVRIAVRDDSTAAPDLRKLSGLDSRGRGLPLVAALAVGWGARAEYGGKVVWAELLA